MKISLTRRAAAPLTFEGELLAEVSSDDGAKDRFTVVAIFRRTDETEGWVLHTRGVSRLSDELELSDAVTCVLAEDVVRALMKSDSSSGTRRYYMTELGLELLAEAAEVDERLAVLAEVEDLV